MKFLIAFFMLTSFDLYAQNCNYNVNVGSFMATIQDAPQVIAHPLQISRPNNSPRPNCGNYRLYFGKGQANNYQRRAYSGGHSVRYNLYQTISLGNVLKDFGDAGANEFISGMVLQPNAVTTSQWFVEVLDQASTFSIPPNVYTDVIPVQVYAVRNNGDIDFQTTRFFTLSFTIPRYAEVSIVPINAPHDPSATTYIMNFGNMTPQQELQADLRIKANVPYGISVSSLNGGQLRKTPNTTPVPYQIKIGNNNFMTPPTWSTWVLNEGSPSTASGRPYRLTVRLGNFTALDDGDYEEAITITVQAY
jgi:hypothetical protein